MLENFIYETHLGKRFVGLERRVYLNYNGLRDYEWKTETTNDRITRLYKRTTMRTLPLVVFCSTEAEAVEVKNLITEMAETDVAAMEPGKVWIGEWYTKGYITVSRKTEYLRDKRICKLELTLTSDKPEWYRERNYVFMPEDNAIPSGTDYPYDYPYDYASPISASRVICEGVFDSDFRLTIYGEAINPAVSIGGHKYAIDGTLLDGQRLVIDSSAKTIQMKTAMGNAFNWFSKRDRSSYIFQPLKPGLQGIVTNGKFGIDITVIEKRSEPKWT